CPSLSRTSAMVTSWQRARPSITRAAASAAPAGPNGSRTPSIRDGSGLTPTIVGQEGPVDALDLAAERLQLAEDLPGRRGEGLVLGLVVGEVEAHVLDVELRLRQGVEAIDQLLQPRPPRHDDHLLHGTPPSRRRVSRKGAKPQRKIKTRSISLLV